MGFEVDLLNFSEENGSTDTKKVQYYHFIVTSICSNKSMNESKR